MSRLRCATLVGGLGSHQPVPAKRPATAVDLAAVGGAVLSPLEMSIRVAAASEGLSSPAMGAAISALVAFVKVPDNTRRVYTDPALRAVVLRVLGVTGGNVRQAERILRSAGGAFALVGRSTIERIRDVGASTCEGAKADVSRVLPRCEGTSHAQSYPRRARHC